jgi:hypothetical protein
MIWQKAMREASSIAMWTNSQPTPRPLLWPMRSPVMRWPTRSMRDHPAGPLTSMTTQSKTAGIFIS